MDASGLKDDEKALASLVASAWMCPAARAASHAPHMAVAMRLAEINTPLRIAHWLGQLGHESGCGQWMREIWGPTPAQVRYEPESALAKRLGNTNKGDGKLMMGRGPIQTTGRHNYRRLTAQLRKMFGDWMPDFEASPELLGQLDWGYISSAMYWIDRGLNRFADDDDIGRLTVAINGGSNGLAHRISITNHTKNLLRI